MIRCLFIDNEDVLSHTVDILWYSRFCCFLRRIGRFIKRIIRWTPVLWNQEEWDYEYAYDLLEVKMKELHKNMSQDIWHEEKGVQKRLKQIEVCLKRLDMWRNWPNYYDYPMDDIVHVPTKDGFYRVEHTSEENEKQRLGAIDFEEKNYNKFWKDFLAWHRGWWT